MRTFLRLHRALVAAADDAVRRLGSGRMGEEGGRTEHGSENGSEHGEKATRRRQPAQCEQGTNSPKYSTQCFNAGNVLGL